MPRSKIIILSILGLIATIIIPKLITQVKADYDRLEVLTDADSTQTNLANYLEDSLHADTALAGCMLIPCPAEDGSISQNSALPFVSSSLAYLTTQPPVHTPTYIADVLDNSGFLAQPVYAQGIGFSALSPVLNLWKVFRNIAYFVYIIMFIIIGLLVMFRANINPQTVVTIQSALPRLIITLILITFSYAIAGFIVDLLYLSIFLITAVFQQNGILTDQGQALDSVFGYSVIGVGFRFFLGLGEGSAEVLRTGSQAVEQLLNVMLPGLFAKILSAIAYLIIAIAVIIALFRTLFSLIGAYVGIILGTIFAPIQLLLNAVPGSTSFTSWLRGILANAAVFPVLVILLIIGAYLTGGNEPNGISSSAVSGSLDSGGFIPPLLGSQSNAAGPQAIQAIIGIGIIMLLPEAVNFVRKFAQVEDTFGPPALAGLQRGAGVITKPLSIIGATGLSVGSYAAQQEGYKRLMNWRANRNIKKATSGKQQAQAKTISDDAMEQIVKLQESDKSENVSPFGTNVPGRKS